MLVNVKELYLAHGLDLKFKSSSGGGEYAGPCPYCGGKDRFLVWPEKDNAKGTYYCRGCDKKGDAIQFMRDFDNMTFKEAYRAVHNADKYNTKNIRPYKEKEKKKSEIKQSEVQVSEDFNFEKWHTKALDFQTKANEVLVDYPTCLLTLMHRGFEIEKALEFGIGYFAGDEKKNCTYRQRSTWGLKNTFAHGKEKKTIWFPRGLVIPTFENFTTKDKIIRLRIRREDADRQEFQSQMKYYVVPGSQMRPLFLQTKTKLLPANFVTIVVEGELDAYMLYQKVGDFCSVLSIMTAKISSLPVDILDFLKKCSLILVSTDIGDKSHAGYDGWLKWRDTFPQAKRWVAIDAKDPGEMAEKKLNIRAWITAALPSIYADKIIKFDEEEREKIRRWFYGE